MINECNFYQTENCPIRDCKIYAKPLNCYLAKKTEELARQNIKSCPRDLIDIILESLNKDEKGIIFQAEGLN